MKEESTGSEKHSSIKETPLCCEESVKLLINYEGVKVKLKCELL